MRLDLDDHQRIARAARSGLALAGKPHLRAVFHPGGQLEVDSLAVRERDALAGQGRGIGQRDAQPVMHIGPAWLRARPAPAKASATKASAGTAPAEQPLEEIAEVHPFGAVKTPGTAPAGEVTAALPAAKARVGRVAVCIDLAPVEARAFVCVGEQVVGPRNFGKVLGRLGIVRVPVGMKLFGELAIGGLDVLLARSTGHAQQGIGVCCHGP